MSEIKDLVQNGCFALIVVLTEKGEVVLRPIGGSYHNGINDTIEELDRMYPNSKMKMFETRYDAWKKYFAPNQVIESRMLDVDT